MQLSHDAPLRAARFDDAGLVSAAGLAPAVAVAQRAGLAALAREHLTVPGGAGCAAGTKVAALVAGMVAGADSIDDMDLLRHGAMPRLFTGVRAPSTLGTFLRAFRFGHVRQLDAVAAGLLARLPQRPRCCPGPGRWRGAGCRTLSRGHPVAALGSRLVTVEFRARTPPRRW